MIYVQPVQKVPNKQMKVRKMSDEVEPNDEKQDENEDEAEENDEKSRDLKKRNRRHYIQGLPLSLQRACQ